MANPKDNELEPEEIEKEEAGEQKPKAQAEKSHEDKRSGKDKKKAKKTNIFARIAKTTAKFFKDIKGEIKKVVWPSRKQLTNNTSIVFAVLFVSAVFVGVVDIILNTFINLVLKL